MFFRLFLVCTRAIPVSDQSSMQSIAAESACAREGGVDSASLKNWFCVAVTMLCMSNEVSSPSLWIGPLNAASQGTAWARSVEAEIGVPSRVCAFDGWMASKLKRRQRVDDKSDRSLPHYRIAPKWYRTARVRHAVRGYSHLLNESNLPLALDPRYHTFAEEAPALKARGVRLALVFHGSDVRSPSRAMEFSEHSYFYDMDSELREHLAKSVERNVAEVEALEVPVFVTTPDLLMHYPGAQWLPLTVDTVSWRNREPAFHHSGRPRVLHRPAAQGAKTKGSEYIMPVLEEMERAGRVELVRAGPVDHAGMKQLIFRADIVVDQLQAGAYGVTAVEAMAAGRLVIADISDHTRSITGETLPVVSATPRTFREVLNKILDNRESAARIAADGSAYVEYAHGGGRTAEVLADFLRS